MLIAQARKRRYEAENPSVASDMGQQALKGLATGIPAIVTGPYDLGKFAADKAVRGVRSVLGYDNSQLPQPEYLTPKVNELISNAMGIGDAKTTAGEYTGTVASFLPGAAVGGGSVLSRILGAAGGGVASEGAGQLAQEYAPSLEPYARMAGGFAGAGASASAAEFAAARPPQGLSRTAAAMVKAAAPDDTTALQKLGPEAMALDASPGLTGLAQGVVVTPSKSSNALVSALEGRNAARSTRLQADAKATFGRPRDVQLREKAIIEQASRKTAPMYTSRIQNAPQLPKSVEDLLSVGMTSPADLLSLSRRAGMKSLFDKVDDALVAGDPQVTAARLWDLRKELDSQIVYDKAEMMGLSSAERSMQSVYKDVRKQIDDVLKNRLGFTEPDKIMATAKKGTEDLKYGYDVLDGGKFAVSPERNAIEMSKRNPQRVQEGATARIGNAMGTQANDLSALKNMIGGDNGWNRAKLEQIYGKDKVAQAVAAVEREQRFARNYADVARNSQTAQRQAAAGMVNKSDAPVFDTGTTMTGMGVRGLTAVKNALLKGVSKRLGASNKEAIAKALMTKGPQAVQLLDELSRLGSIPATAGSRALIAALLAANANLGNAQGNNRP